jgi:hypothetical protein
MVVRLIGTSPPNERYVAQVYLDVLRRLADPQGLSFWTGQIDQGLSRSALAAGFTQSAEYRTLLLNDLYGGLFHRSADPQGLADFQALFNSGSTLEHVKALFFGSDEYSQTHGAGSNDKFLDALYSDVLGRAVDPGARAALDQALAEGVSRTAIAQSILQSQEGYQGLVGSLYFTFLHRKADGAGLNQFVNDLQQGIRDEMVIGALVGSDEYFGRA